MESHVGFCSSQPISLSATPGRYFHSQWRAQPGRSVVILAIACLNASCEARPSLSCTERLEFHSDCESQSVAGESQTSPENRTVLKPKSRWVSLSAYSKLPKQCITLKHSTEYAECMTCRPKLVSKVSKAHSVKQVLSDPKLTPKSSHCEEYEQIHDS